MLCRIYLLLQAQRVIFSFPSLFYYNAANISLMVLVLSLVLEMKEARVGRHLHGRVVRCISKLRKAASPLQQEEPMQEPCSATEYLSGHRWFLLTKARLWAAVRATYLVGDNCHVVRMSPSITTQTVHGFHYLGRILCLVNISHYPFSELAINIPVKEFSLESGHSKISSSNNNKKMGLYNKRYNFKS